jgi:hypothetical protein
VTRDQAHFADAAPASRAAEKDACTRAQNGTEHGLLRRAGQHLSHRQQRDQMELAHLGDLLPTADPRRDTPVAVGLPSAAD